MIIPTAGIPYGIFGKYLQREKSSCQGGQNYNASLKLSACSTLVKYGFFRIRKINFQISYNQNYLTYSVDYNNIFMYCTEPSNLLNI